MTAAANAAAELELLRRHAPRLRFDSCECLRPTTVDAYVEASAVLDGHDRVTDAADGGLAKLAQPGTRLWRLRPLPPESPDGGEERSNALLERFAGARAADRPAVCYGRVQPARGSIFLQYWFFYVDNPCVLDPGRHDGDWELVQLRLTPARRLTHVTVAQHGGPETRSVAPGITRPEIFVAVGSHASYLRAGTQPKLPLADECDALGPPAEELRVEPFPADRQWWTWRGRWGMDRGPGSWLATRLHLPRTPWFLRWLNGIGAGDSPASPRWQHASWGAPARWQATGAAHRVTRVALRELLHRLGRMTWPRNPPAVEVNRVEPRAVSIRAQPAGRGPRRIFRVSFVFQDAAGGRPLGTHTVRADGRSHSVALGHGGELGWRAAGYNRLRQRGNTGERQVLAGPG